MGYLSKIIIVLGILILGFVVALFVTNSEHIQKTQVYVLSVPPYEFDLSDGKKAYIVLDLFFSSEKLAKIADNNINDIYSILERIFYKVSSKDLASTDGLLKLTAEIYLILNKTHYGLLGVKFKTNPKVY